MVNNNEAGVTRHSFKHKKRQRHKKVVIDFGNTHLNQNDILFP